MGERRFHKSLQAVCRANRLCFSVIKRPQIAQRLEKLRGQNKGEEACCQRDARAVVAEIKFAEVGKTKVNRDQRNGKRGKKLQYARG